MVRRAAALGAALLASSLAVAMTGCSHDVDSVESSLWLQVDGAERDIYGVLKHLESSTSPADGLFDRLSAVTLRWDPEQGAPSFPDDSGAAVVHDFHETDDGARFDVFVASGTDDRAGGWFRPQPRRVYTCYRIEVFVDAGLVSGFYREDQGDERLECPPDLVRALGEGAQYRVPWVFDG